MDYISDQDKEIHPIVNDDQSLESRKMENKVEETVVDEMFEYDDLYNTNTHKASRNNLGVNFEPSRRRSPVTVQEWVATLPDQGNEEQEEEDQEIFDNNERLRAVGEKAGSLDEPQRIAELLLNKTEKSKRNGWSNPRRAILQHSETLTSVGSEQSQYSTSSSCMAGVLHSREANPEQVLKNLGFAKSEVLTRIPDRFLQHQSQAKGVSIECFKKQQEDLMGSFESGFFGYRGLSGSLYRRPSGIVEKILNTLKEQEKEKQRNEKTVENVKNLDSSQIPERFKRMNPDRPQFHNVVRQISKAKAEDKIEPKSFRSLAQSVLSNENREWRQQQQQVNLKKRRKAQLLVMGGKSFMMDEDGHEEEVIKNEEYNLKPALNRLKKQDSVQSANSLKSDWSDDEIEELEKQLEVIMNRDKTIADKELKKQKVPKFSEDERLEFKKTSDEMVNDTFPKQKILKKEETGKNL